MPIKVEKLSHIYMKGTAFQKVALDDVGFEINDGELIGLIGHTGSGKSTLIQHLNGLLKPSEGKIYIDSIDISSKEVPMRLIRQKVGLVFQYPEHQLFEETVYKDVAFGPRNLGLDEEQIKVRVTQSLKMVGLNYNEIKDISPFELSGGQKRRVAIAGVLAMQPKILILDEPTAGLDPKGRDEILGEIKRLHVEQGLTVIIVSHSMEDIANIAERLLVMSKGKIVFFDTPKSVFREVDVLEKIGLGVPQVTYLIRKLQGLGFEIEDCVSIDEAKKELLRVLRGRTS